jgi:hypothetical protein
MRILRPIVCAVLLVAFGMTTLSMGAEFYVIKSRSGLLRVVDHKPKGGATVVKGPFGSREEADMAIKDLRGTVRIPAQPEDSGATPAK